MNDRRELTDQEHLLLLQFKLDAIGWRLTALAREVAELRRRAAHGTQAPMPSVPHEQPGGAALRRTRP